MRISKAKARENRDRVVNSAARMFRERGFDSVAVADLMREAGMTHGGFYNHFGSKDELGAAACEHVFEGALQRMGAIADVDDAEERAAAYEAYRRRYVSKTARDAPGPSCPMVAFAGDMARRPEEIRAVYAKGLRAYLARLTRASGRDPDNPAARAEAYREFATLAGALILARGVAREDPELSEEILRAAGGQE